MAETPGEWGDHVGSVGREATPARSPGGDPGAGGGDRIRLRR